MCLFPSRRRSVTAIPLFLATELADRREHGTGWRRLPTGQHTLLGLAYLRCGQTHAGSFLARVRQELRVRLTGFAARDHRRPRRNGPQMLDGQGVSRGRGAQHAGGSRAGLGTGPESSQAGSVRGQRAAEAAGAAAANESVAAVPLPVRQRRSTMCGRTAEVQRARGTTCIPQTITMHLNVIADHYSCFAGRPCGRIPSRRSCEMRIRRRAAGVLLVLATARAAPARYPRYGSGTGSRRHRSARAVALADSRRQPSCVCQLARR